MQSVTRGIIATALAWAMAVTILALTPAQAEAAGLRFVGGWIPYWSTEQNLRAFRDNAELFSDVSPFWHALTGDTSVSDQERSSDRSAVISAARQAGVPVVPAITDGMGRGRLAQALADPQRRSTIVATMVSLVETRGYDGLDLDLEGFAFADGRSTWSTTRPAWVAFVTELGGELRSRGKALHVTIPPTYNSNRTANSGYWVYDYAGIAPHVDRVRLMAYDYSVGSPGPIAPYWWVERVVDYAVTQIPAHKVVLGIPAYGRNWVTDVAGSCPDGTSLARTAVTSAGAWDLAAKHQANVRWDAANQESYFEYEQRFASDDAECTVTRTVHFVGGEATQARAGLALERDLRGVALWTVGGADAGTWQELHKLAAGRGQPLAPRQVLQVPVAGGSTGTPADAEAVSLNVTATAPRTAGFLGVYPCGTAWPGTSNVNFAAGQTVAANVLVGVGTEGSVCVYASTTVDVVVDVGGYFPAGSTFDQQQPQRLRDTRAGAKLAGGTDIAIKVPDGIAAAALSITATEPERAGWVSAYPCGTAWPGTSTVNFTADQTIAASSLVRPGADGRICLRSLVSTHLVVDLMGTVRAGQGFQALQPTRITDTRQPPGQPIGGTRVASIDVGGSSGAVALNITATGSGANGWVQAYPCGAPPALTSNVNFEAGQTIANSTLVKVGGDGTVCLRSNVATHVVVDRTSAFGLGSRAFVATDPARLLDTREQAGQRL